MLHVAHGAWRGMTMRLEKGFNHSDVREEAEETLPCVPALCGVRWPSRAVYVRCSAVSRRPRKGTD